ncbi:MAG TPA: cytochrome c [Caulobacteraceae bacterium]
MNRPRALALAAAVAGLAMTAPGAGQPVAPPATPAVNPQVEEGRYLAALGDCESCHDRPGGQKLAGGLPLNTPFGVIYSANITPDRDTGIGAWSEADFYRAMHEGRNNHNAHLYPAFPYAYFTRMSRAEVDAIRAYLMAQPAVSYRPRANRLPFPLSIRALVGVWNWLYFKPGDFQPAAGQSAAWNRGAYIVEGPGHCGACHTPKTFLGGDKQQQALQGGQLDNWFAPDLNGDARGGLADWTTADIVEFLKTGRNARSSASGSMSDVIVHSTSQMNDGDLAAVATYLKSLPAAKAAAPAPAAPDPAAMQAGAALYLDNCAACHRADGAGVPREFPPLKGNSNVQTGNPTTVDRFILSGTESTATDARPTPLAMPSFAWKLTDAEIADVATYIRNSWGNAAPPVSAGDVAKLRGKVAAHPVRKPSEKA